MIEVKAPRKSYAISGAASGIGRAVAEILAGANAETLILVDHDENGLRDTAKKLPSTMDIRLVCADVSNPQIRESIKKSCEGIALNGLIAAAGIQSPSSGRDDEAWEKIFATNFHGARLFIDACLPCLDRHYEKFAHIVVIGSAMSKFGSTGYGAYSASKAALESLVKTMAVELGKDKILVNAVSPGWVETSMLSNVIRRRSKLTKLSPDDIQKNLRLMSPSQKISTADEIAELVWFLLSGRQTSITGQVLAIDNGIGLLPFGL